LLRLAAHRFWCIESAGEPHQGSFVLQDHGTLAGITVRGEWFVVPGSGTGELTDLRGEGGLTPNLVNVPRLPLTIGSSPDLT